MATDGFVLLWLWFYKCFGWTGTRLPSWAMNTKQSPRPAVSQGITQMLNMYLSWILTIELIKRVWYLSFLPILLVQSNWPELCLSDQVNLSSGPFLGYKLWLLDREKDNANPVLWLASRGHFRAYVQSFSSREDSHMNTKERILTPRVFSTVIKTKYCVECLQGQRVLKIVVPELLA